MSKRLFVGNIPYKTVEAELAELFSQWTVTELTIIRDRETGNSKFAFVEMPNDEEAAAAIEFFSKEENQMFNGRPLAVNEARPREERPQGGGYNRGGDRGGYNRGGDRGGFGGGSRGGFGGGSDRGFQGNRRDY